MSASNDSGAPVAIRKADGNLEPLSPAKLYRSLRACGADKALARKVVDTILREPRTDFSTGDLTRLTSKLLTRECRHLAGRYLLKRALMELGPTGYPFERLVAAILEAQGYRTEVGAIWAGKCVSHEIDVVARRHDQLDLVECKFRNGAGTRCDVKIALYVHARALDLRAHPGGPRFDRFFLITNTKFTGDAIRYAECVGLELLGWDYPHGQTLPSLIEAHGLHPLTCLTTLKQADKRALLDEGLLLCRDLRAAPAHLDALGLAARRREKLMDEIHALSSPAAPGPERPETNEGPDSSHAIGD